MKDSRSDCKRVVLVAAVGTSPAVLTETVWALAHGDKPLVPDQIVVITTAQGRRSIESELLSGRPSVWATMTAALAREKIPGAAALKLGSTDIRVVPDADNNEAEDLRSVGDNLRAADFMLGELRKHTEDPDTVVYASIAGGRKTMSALLLSCMSLLAREDDKVFHVLTVPEPIGFAPKYYFPQKGVAHVYKDKDKARRIASAKVKVELFEVPFVPVRGWFREKFNTLPPRYSEMVHALRAGGPRAVAYPEIEFDFDGSGSVCLLPARSRVSLSAVQFALLAVIASGCDQKKWAGRMVALRQKMDSVNMAMSVLWNDRLKGSTRFLGLKEEDDVGDLARVLSELRQKLVRAGMREAENLVPKRGGNMLFPRSNFKYVHAELLPAELRGYLLPPLASAGMVS